MRINILYILLFVLGLFSCEGNKSTMQRKNENDPESISPNTLPLGIQFRLKCEQMEQDSLLPGVKHYTYDILL